MPIENVADATGSIIIITRYGGCVPSTKIPPSTRVPRYLHISARRRQKRKRSKELGGTRQRNREPDERGDGDTRRVAGGCWRGDASSPSHEGQKAEEREKESPATALKRVRFFFPERCFRAAAPLWEKRAASLINSGFFNDRRTTKSGEERGWTKLYTMQGGRRGGGKLFQNNYATIHSVWRERGERKTRVSFSALFRRSIFSRNRRGGGPLWCFRYVTTSCGGESRCFFVRYFSFLSSNEEMSIIISRNTFRGVVSLTPLFLTFRGIKRALLCLGWSVYQGEIWGIKRRKVYIEIIFEIDVDVIYSTIYSNNSAVICEITVRIFA